MKNYTKKITFIIAILIAGLFHSKTIFSQSVAVNDDGSAPNANAILDIDISTNDAGILIPRLTTAERTGTFDDSFGASEDGLTVYDETLHRFYYWNTTAWQELTVQGANWSILGNTGINPATDFFGTTDAQPIIFKTNGAERARFLSSGNLGIGITSPDAPLHVDGSVDATYSDATGYLVVGDINDRNLVLDANEILARNNGASSNLYVQNLGGDMRIHYDASVGHDDGSQFVVQNDGDVGIGTYLPPVRLFVTENGATPEAYISSWGTDGDAKLRLCENASSTYYGFEFKYDGTNNRLDLSSKEFVGNDAIRMTVLSNGNIGFGSTNPQKILHIRNAVPYIRFDDTDGGNYWEAGNSGGEFRIYEDVTERFEIEAGGNVGIGTDNPDAKLHVLLSGTVMGQYAGTVAAFQQNNITTDWSRISIIAGNTGASLIDFGDADKQDPGSIKFDHTDNYFAFFTNNTDERMRITSSGNVGIMVTDPDEVLEVNGAIHIGYTSNSNTGAIRWDNGASHFQGYNGSAWVNLDAQPSGSAGGWTDDGTDVRLTTVSDNVGIGTATPNEKLEVNGSIRMTDGNEAAGYTMVSDANGTASWSNETDNVKTRVIRQINGGTSTEVTIWSHPEGIDVKFHPGTETVTVTNATGDAAGVYWDIVIIGDATSDVTRQGVTHITNYIANGSSLIHDLDTEESTPNNAGWFQIIGGNQNNQKDGFIINVVYYGDDLNGTVQYWDN